MHRGGVFKKCSRQGRDQLWVVTGDYIQKPFCVGIEATAPIGTMQSHFYGQCETRGLSGFTVCP